MAGEVENLLVMFEEQEEEPVSWEMRGY